MDTIWVMLVVLNLFPMSKRAMVETKFSIREEKVEYSIKEGGKVDEKVENTERSKEAEGGR